MSDEGFTLLEMVMVMVVVGVIATIGTGAIGHWRDTSEEQGSAQQVVSQLRNASEKATSEGRTYCVDLSSGGRTVTLWRYSCGGPTGVASGAKSTQSSRVTFTSTVTAPSPAAACPAGDGCVYFYPRGTATPATVLVKSSRRTTVYTIHVEGLTARVWM